jgi:putative redox protein
MVEMDIVYQGDLHCEATHGPSGARLTTDAPKDNEGKGEAFSPTDLVGAALGTCLVTTMGIYARRQKIDITGTRVHVVKEMVADPRRRIGKLTVRVHVPRTFDEPTRRALEQAARGCPVHASLHPDVKAPIEFVWG